MSAISMLTKEELLLYRSYKRKKYHGKLSEITPEERAANSKYDKLCVQLNPLRRRYTILRSHAKERGIEFSLTFDRYIELVNTSPTCPVLGCTLDYSVYHGRGKQDNAASVDRIDSTKGYTDDNCWIISHKANQIKSNATLEEIEQLVSALRRLISVSQV